MENFNVSVPRGQPLEPRPPEVAALGFQGASPLDPALRGPSGGRCRGGCLLSLSRAQDSHGVFNTVAIPRMRYGFERPPSNSKWPRTSAN